MYRVNHAAHRLPQECTLIRGNTFPRCSKCDDAVEFECIASTAHWQPSPTRTIILHELPEVPPDMKRDEDVA